MINPKSLKSLLTIVLEIEGKYRSFKLTHSTDVVRRRQINELVQQRYLKKKKNRRDKLAKKGIHIVSDL